MDRGDHALILLRPGDGEHVGITCGDLFRLGTHAAGDDHLAVFGQRRADRLERLRLRAVEEAAGVDDDEVGAVMLARELIALRAQARDDALGIDQRLGAAERDKAHFRRAQRRSLKARRSSSIRFQVVQVRPPCRRQRCGTDRLQHGHAALVHRRFQRLAPAKLPHLALAQGCRRRHMGFDAQFAQRVGDLVHFGGAANAVIGHAFEVVFDHFRPIEARESFSTARR